jgi:hypothetical protein
MKNNIGLIILSIISILLISFAFWYWCIADCSFIKNWLWGTGSVPARCIKL